MGGVDDVCFSHSIYRQVIKKLVVCSGGERSNNGLTDIPFSIRIIIRVQITPPKALDRCLLELSISEGTNFISILRKYSEKKISQSFQCTFTYPVFITIQCGNKLKKSNWRIKVATFSKPSSLWPNLWIWQLFVRERFELYKVET